MNRSMETNMPRPRSALAKRLLDLALTVPAFLVLLPAIGLLALLVRLRLGGPAFFRQQRPGLLGKPFPMYKLRTMTDERDGDGRLLPDHMRLTPLGRMLRKYSLDELPQLWNVIRGDLSLIGPRPLLMDYMKLYTPEQARRHLVKPGMTGWAQVNGRNAIAWEQKFELDIWYVDNGSMLLDLKIIRLSLFKVLRSEGIRSANHATMPIFEGSGGKHESG